MFTLVEGKNNLLILDRAAQFWRQMTMVRRGKNLYLNKLELTLCVPSKSVKKKRKATSGAESFGLSISASWFLLVPLPSPASSLYSGGSNGEMT